MALLTVGRAFENSCSAGRCFTNPFVVDDGTVEGMGMQFRQETPEPASRTPMWSS